jgi:hypothetical protein
MDAALAGGIVCAAAGCLMAKLKAKQLYDSLEVDGAAKGVFGICYSIITWSGVGKGLGWRPKTWGKTVGKLFENGHATTFLIDRTKKPVRITLTGINDDGWLFEQGSLNATDWARDTGNADTFVYYIGVNAKFLDTYAKVKANLMKTKTSYSVLWPNLGRTRYENCVSHCHYLMSALGIAYWTNRKGWWVPSVSNWVDWFKSFVPVRTGGFWWKYKVFRHTNTHIPAEPGT